MTRPRSASPQFGMDFDYDGGDTTVVLHGELDALSVPAFSGALGALADRGARVVVIDLTELRFCNIGGLRAMAELAARVNAVEGRVEIIAASILTRMLELGDLQSLFVIHDPDTLAADQTTLDLVDLTRAPRSSRPRASSLHRLPTA